MSQILEEASVLLLGERHPSKIIWTQLYDASESYEEDDLRKLLLDVKTHIQKRRIKSGSARKFLDGKLLYYEINRTPEEKTRNKLICVYTQDQNIGSVEKRAVELIAYRGGAFNVYSAKRFFSEMVDLIKDPKQLNQSEVPLETAITRIKEIYESSTENVSVNELGQLISLINRSLEMDRETLEKLYFIVYETIDSISEAVNGDNDPDEFLDASYLIARKYEETANFYLALELFKKIIPVGIRNNRFDLETACRIKIASIYKENFPEPGEYIIDTLAGLSEAKHLKETSQTYVEQYHCLLGFAYQNLKMEEQAIVSFQKAIDVGQSNISSPIWIAEAYNYLGDYSRKNSYLTEASRHYLTAAAISFSAGDVTLADMYSDRAAFVELRISYSLIHMAVVLRMEGGLKDAEYRAWDSLRILVRSFYHAIPQRFIQLQKRAMEILKEAEGVLNIPGKIRKNRSVLHRIEKSLKILCEETSEKREVSILDQIVETIEENIPIPPPTFMLLTLDGRLITMGEIHDGEWRQSGIEGVILSGILSAIMSLISEVSEEKSALRTVDAGTFQIMIEQSDNIVSVLLMDRDIPEYRSKLVTSLELVDEEYGDVLRYWDGNMAVFDDLQRSVVSIFE